MDYQNERYLRNALYEIDYAQYNLRQVNGLHPDDYYNIEMAFKLLQEAADWLRRT